MLKQYFRFVIPSIFSMVIFNLYTLVDGIFVAHFVNATALAGINVASPYITIIFAIGVLFAIGSSTVMSIYRGQNNTEMMHKVFTMNSITISCIALLISIGSFCFSTTITSFLGANAEVFSYSSRYIRIISCFAFFYIVAYCFEVLLKADGYPHKSIIGVAIGAFTNIALDAIFMGVFSFGLPGAALATGISQMLTFCYFLSHFIGNKKSHFHFVKGPYPWREYRRLFVLGLSDFIAELSPGIMIMAFNYRINQLLSTSGLVSFSVVIYIYNLVLMAMVGISQGTQPLLSYYYGKKDRSAMHQIHRYARILVSALSILLFLIIELFAPIIVSFFLAKGNNYQTTIFALRIFALVFLPMGHVVITSGMLTAVEKPKQSLLLSLLRGIFFIIASLYLCTYLWHANGIWISPLLSELFTLIIALYFLHQQRHLL